MLCCVILCKVAAIFTLHPCRINDALVTLTLGNTAQAHFLGLVGLHWSAPLS